MLTKNQSAVDAMDVEAATSQALSLSVTPRHDVLGKDNVIVSMTQVCATIKAMTLPLDDETQRAPVDIVVGLDVSGSMGDGDKLDLCKSTLELLLRQLRQEDRFGLISFADEAVIEIPARKMTDKSKQSALDKIKMLKTRGCTNISAAVGLAAQEMGAIEAPNEVRSIFLLTDGLANRGVCDSAGIVDVARGCLGQAKDDTSPPITIHSFGYGTDHDDKLLADLSEATRGGSYYFVESDSNVAGAFGDALGGILSVVAQNVVLHVQVPTEAAAMGVEIASVHHEHKVQREDGSFSVPIGDFYAEESRDIIFDVKLASPSAVTHTPIPHALVSLGYLDTIKKHLVVSDPATCSISRPPGIEVSMPNRHVALQWLRVYASQEIAEADKISLTGNLSGARTKLLHCKEYILAQDSLLSDPLVVQLVTDLDKAMSGISSRESYATYGSKFLKTTRQAHTMQRCSEPCPHTPSVYRSARKATMSMQFQTPK